jgi:hypothetical protein
MKPLPLSSQSFLLANYPYGQLSHDLEQAPGDPGTGMISSELDENRFVRHHLEYPQ